MIEKLLGTRFWNDSYKDVCAYYYNDIYETGIRLSELVGLDDVAVDFVKSTDKGYRKRNKQHNTFW